MSIALIAVVLVLLLSHALPGLAGWRRLEAPWRAWRGLGARFGAHGAGLAALVWLLLPVLALWLLQGWLAERWWGLLLLPYGVLLLFLSWGPRDLDADARALLDAADEGASRRARRDLEFPEADAGAAEAVSALFRAARARWFGPLLWFVILGGAGALLYRFAALACQEPPRQGSVLALLNSVLNWPVAALMALSLALVANFDAVLQAWRGWQSQPGRRWVGHDLGFLDAAAQSSVVCELREEVAEDAEDAAMEGASTVLLPPSDALVPTLQTAVEDSLSLLRRILVLWMALLALAVIGGIAG